MATVALRRPAVLGRLVSVRVPAGVALGALTLLSIALRVHHLRTPFWIDEGISVGISSHPLHEIPGVLRLDGSPPLYYMALHVWMSLFGHSQVSTHLLSGLFAALTVPASWWAGRSLFGTRVGWALATLAAINPFMTSYAQETRMYTLVVLLGTLCTACFLHAYVFRRRKYIVPFGLSLAAMLYAHNWTLFYILGLLIAVAFAYRDSDDRRLLLRDALYGFGLAALVYLPWVPTLIDQALHTGAPWATRPTPKKLIHAPDALLGSFAGTIAVLLAGGTGIIDFWHRSRRERRVLIPALLSLSLGTILIAWLVSQVSPAWATRYLAVAVAPLLMLGAVALFHGSRLGIAAFCFLVLSWTFAGAPAAKSNAHYVSTTFAHQLKRHDLVLATQPEQIPVLHYYLPPGLRYATEFGLQKDPGVVDWRDGPAHFDRTGVDKTLLPLLRNVRVGHRVMLVEPIMFFPDNWEAPWSKRVAERTIEYDGILRGDPRFRLIATVPTNYRLPGPNPLLGLLFQKVRPG